MRRFYAPENKFIGSTVILDADESRHLRDVLRLNTGEEVSVFDGVGHEFRCVIREIDRKTSELTILSEIPPTAPESTFHITLAATVLKGDKFDLVIQKAVELGVSVLVPLKTIRCEIKLEEASKRMERWRRIALEATKQSGRALIMKIAEPSDFPSLLALSRDENVVLFSERDGEAFSTVPKGRKLTAIVGPTGGWEDSELSAARSGGAAVVTLGGRILRAETASISIISILQHRFGDLK